MPFKTLSSGLTLQIPTAGTKNWSATLEAQNWQKLSEHDHTGSGKGKQIGTNALSNLAVTAAKIASDAVTTAKILDDNVTTAKIAPNAITPTEIAADAVTTAKILDSNVTTAKIADGNVTTVKILDSNVTTAKIADSNVTTAKIADANITTIKILDSNVTLAKLAAAVQEALVPAGSILPTGRSSSPSGYLLCDGSAVNRTTYAALFAAISTTYGVGDGSTTFNLPNLQGRFPLGKATSGTGSVLGDTGGSLDHDHVVAAHYHEMGAGANLTLSNGLADTRFLAYNAGGALGPQAASGTKVCDNNASAVPTFSGAIGLVTGGVDGNSPQFTSDSNPAFQVVNYIIKT